MFVQQLPKNDPRPLLLLLDGHSSHTYNMPFLNLMKEKNMHILCYPPHTTHALQPADKALFRSLKHHCMGKSSHRKKCPGRFRRTEMFPLNKDAIDQRIYAPSITTERALPPTVSGLPAAAALPPTVPDLPEEPLGLYTFTDDDQEVVEEVVLEFLQEEETSLYSVLTQEEASCQDEQPSSSTVSE
ncbi:hypothetical protein SKAU_G00237610 [Synaphobranchus kaupii]|uniref:DDE-1 domain-containing protein n=1 Tax=Synaphobranchus kaupii TaxID=118154 RepID=A0A9Q1IT07_SYNKA|nr:hypothetical protein SKAU_G00237610 [Synaphobranchus kaupii]